MDWNQRLEYFIILPIIIGITVLGANLIANLITIEYIFAQINNALPGTMS